MTKRLQFALFIVIGSLFVAGALTAADADERTAMVAIRSYLGGISPYWSDTALSQLCQPSQIVQFVRCTDGHVSGIDFTDAFVYSFTGPLGNITGLRFLKSLTFGKNAAVPDLDIWYPQLYNLTTLSYENIDSGVGSSPVFTANFTLNPFFSNLTYIDRISQDMLDEIVGAPNLKSLTITMPKVSSIRSDYFAGMNLTHLSLSTTGNFNPSFILEFPDFSHLTYLETLDLSSTAIRVLQNNFTNLVNLRRLKLDFCMDLRKIAPSVSNCVKLESIDCTHCRLNGADSLPDLSATRLNELKLVGNFMTTWPDGLCQLSTNPQEPGLKIAMSSETLADPPACFGNTVRLHSASFVVTAFTSFPTIFANMNDLKYLQIVQSPQMAGGIPDLSGTSLTELDLRLNSLDGNFPAGLPTSLEILRISDNKMGGVIPSNAFAGLSSLKFIELSNNTFEGPFPSSIAETRAGALLAGENKFTSIPDSIRGLNFLFTLKFNNNFLESLPSISVWREMRNLSSVNLSHNRNLNGPLPLFWNERNSTIKAVDLSGCSFSGDVPSINATVLSELRLSENALDGTILPITYAFYLTVFRVDRNLLTGSIPPSIGTFGTGFTNLRVFDVSFNRLTGSFPSSFSNVVPLLTELSFNNNGIEGSLPDLSASPNLQILNGHTTNIRLCDANPGLYSHTRCDLYDVQSPGSCGCESWYTTCTTNTTCPAPDYVAPVNPPGTAAPTPVLPPGSAPILPPHTPSPSSGTPYDTPSSTPSQEPSVTSAPVASAPTTLLDVSILLFVTLGAIIMF